MIRWKKYGLLSISKVNSKLFLFHLNKEEECNQLLKGEPFSFDN